MEILQATAIFRFLQLEYNPGMSSLEAVAHGSRILAVGRSALLKCSADAYVAFSFQPDSCRCPGPFADGSHRRRANREATDPEKRGRRLLQRSGAHSDHGLQHLEWIWLPLDYRRLDQSHRSCDGSERAARRRLRLRESG